MSDQDPTHPATEADDDPRLLAAMAEYMAALDAGKRVNRRELLARHPDIAAELSACLQGLAFVHNAAGQLTDGGPVPPPTDGSADDTLQGEPLGDYRLVREIGRGGMGVVYEAVQLSLGRRVAVKVLPMAAALDPRRLQRFKNEAQAAAGLHHTNIVPVYAVGSDRSTHFYAMQLIDGRSLAEVIRELRAAGGAGPRRSAVARRLLDPTAGPPTADLGGVTAGDHTEPLPRPTAPAPSVGGASAVAPSASWSGPRPADALSTLHGGRRGEYFRTVAKLGIQAAEALDYAHNLGIIHRDIKPANLMVDGGGNLWVTDFGLAQMLGDNGLTQTGDFVGTFRYMSPEQAGGRPGHLGTGRRHRPAADEASDDSAAAPVVLDPRTDVYSLGVTLYELLTLQPALPGRTRDDLMVQLAAVDPKPPRAIDKAIPPELQTIVLKAAAKDPADRYPSARALADDLARFMADEPIHARPPTVWDHAVKWTRRHRSLALSAIVVLTLAAAGLGASTLVVSAEKGRAQAGEAEARRQADRAQAAYVQARLAVDALTKVAADELPNIEQTSAVRRSMLTTARAYYQQLLAAHAGSAATDPDLIQAQRRVAALYAELVATDERYRLRFNLRLLARPAVQKAVSMTSDQALRAADLADAVGGPGGPGGGGPRGDDKGGGTDAGSAADLRADLAGLLRPPQLRRLNQISLQLRGLAAFDDPEVQQTLAFTPDQTDAVRKIRAAAGPDGPGGGPGGGPPFDGFGGDRRGGGRHGPPPDAGSAQSVQRVVDEVLTVRQQADWAALIGPPFADPSAPLFGGGGGGRHHHEDGDGGPPFVN